MVIYSLQQLFTFSARNALFAIDDKYPYNDKIVLKKEVTVSFNCSSTKPW